MENKVVVVFSGYNPRAVITFLRTLCINYVSFVIVAKSEKDIIFKTVYRKNVIWIRQNEALELGEILECFRYIKDLFNTEKLFIAPSTEALNRFLLLEREIFEEIGCEIPLISKALYEEISDKYSFCKLCKQEGVDVPEEISREDVLGRFPVVIKPKAYQSIVCGRGYNASPAIIRNQQELNAFLAENREDEYYFQEFLEGESFYLLYYFRKNGEIKKLSQKNLMQQPGGKSILAAEFSEIHLTDISAKYEMMLKQKGFIGLIMIEVRKSNGRYYMIEANPRFWGPSQLFVNAGENLFIYFLADYGLVEEPEEPVMVNYSAKYYWKGGIAETYKEGKAPVMLSSNIHVEDFEPYDIYWQADTMPLFIEEL